MVPRAGTIWHLAVSSASHKLAGKLLTSFNRLCNQRNAVRSNGAIKRGVTAFGCVVMLSPLRSCQGWSSDPRQVCALRKMTRASLPIREVKRRLLPLHAPVLEAQTTSEKKAARVIFGPDLIGALFVSCAHSVAARLVDVVVGLLFAPGRLSCVHHTCE